MSHVFLISTGTVFLAEMGDKTQLLSLFLAARFKKPLPVLGGILLATLLNHGLAGGIGVLLSDWLNPVWLEWFLFVSFLGMAGWMLIPDKLDDSCDLVEPKAVGILLTTAFAFFMAEMGDKTQVATIAIAAQFHDFFSVVAGTTCGMMLADGGAVYLGQRFAERLPKQRLQQASAALLFVLACWSLVEAIKGSLG